MHDHASLLADLAPLPLRGRIVLVHSGYKALGAVRGGPEAVVAALIDAVGPDGTLMAPAFTTDLVDPATWPTPPTAERRDELLRTIPPFDPTSSAPYKMGAVAAALWRTPGAVRSHHPVTSWVALGRDAHALTAEHPLDDPEGPESPIGRAWKRDAVVLLAGVDHDANTTIHLAESLLDMPHLRELPDRYVTVEPDGTRVWRPIAKTTKCSDGFVRIGPHLDPATTWGRLGDAAVRGIRSADVVRIARALLVREPTALLCDDPTCVHCPTSARVLAAWRPPGDET